jgi:hypothetical protein
MAGDDEDTLPRPVHPPSASAPDDAQPHDPDAVYDAELDEPAARGIARLAVRVAGGAPIALDLAVRIGRAPVAPRIPEAVALVTVASPTGMVSSTHLEVRQSGRTAVLRDLGSTNGSRVAPPGVAPRTLARGDSMVVPAGTAVDLGDGVVVAVVEADEEERS